MRTAILVLLLPLVVISTPLCSQTIVNVTLTKGSIFTGPGSMDGSYPITSFMTAPGYTVTNVTGDDPGDVGIGTICNAQVGGCTPATIASDIVGNFFGIVALPPNGGMVVNGQQFGMWGFPGFKATTFNSSVSANGVLTVYGIATEYGSFNECDLLNYCGGLPGARRKWNANTIASKLLADGRVSLCSVFVT